MPEEGNLYQPPRQMEALPPGMPWHAVLFSFKGRIRRKTYWLFSLPVTLAIALIFERCLQLARLHHLPLPDSALPPPEIHAGSMPLLWQAMIMLALYLPLLWMKLAILAKRWHDQNRSANWLLVSFIPLIGGVINFLECGLNPGTRGPNRYGPDPLPEPPRDREKPPKPPRRRPASAPAPPP